MSKRSENMHVIHRRNDPVPRGKGEGVPSVWPSNKKLCVECKTMQPRRGGNDMGLTIGWLCKKCLDGE